MTSTQIALVHLLLAGEAIPEEGPVAELARAHPEGLARARALVAAGIEPPTTPAATAALFDRLAALSPEAAVAIYSLGDAGLLDAATEELVEVVERWARTASPSRSDGEGGRCGAAVEGAQHSDAVEPRLRFGPLPTALPWRGDVLDFGCGIGRVARALAARGARVTGIDVSEAMIAQARARGGEIDYRIADSVRGFPDARFDLIVAADSFPYLVAGALIAGEFARMARVLRPGGRLIVFHWSYRGDLAADIAEARALAAANGLGLIEAGARPFRIWDAPGFLLEKPA